MSTNLPGVAIIGTGAVCCAGLDSDSAFASLRAGKDGLRRLSLLDSKLKEVPWVGQIEADLDALCGSTMPNRTVAMALLAARQSLGALQIPPALRIGLVFATTVGGMARSEEFYQKFLSDSTYINHASEDLAFHEPTATSGYLARTLNLDGFITLSTACSSGLHAIGMAKRLIDNNEYDLCLAIGADALCLLTLRGFSSLMLLDSHGCRPFDAARAGISLGEGAGGVLLASTNAVAALQTSVLAIVKGWGASADAHHMTAPQPQGLGALQAMRSALAEADISPDEIDYVITHGTATPDNDLAEIQALRELCPTLPPFASLKRGLGHTLAASGSLEAVFAVKALQHQLLLPTPGFSTLDTAIAATPVIQSVEAPLTHILKNAFGFGGNNAALILSRAN